MINATVKGVISTMLFVFALLFSYSANAQDTLLISEYIEGSGNNKAIELYNPNDSALNLDNYQIAQSSNGAGWAFYHEFPAGATIPAYGTYVIITDAVDPALFDANDADEVLGFPSVVHHNGNDARATIHITGTDTTFIDVFGDPDSDQTWDVAGTSGAASEQTLVRKSDVSTGNATPLGSFGTDEASSEWIIFDQNDFTGLGYHRFDDAPITIRDLNTYEGVTEFSVAALEDHPLVDSLVTFTAVITSYPKSSGLASPVTNDNGDVTGIGRIHVFITDTSAVSMGREGMSIQIVESDYALLQDFTRGAVVTFDARLGFFNGTSQVGVESVSLLGNVNDNFPEYASLLEPWEVDLNEINTFTDGELAMNFANYTKYNAAYVKINSATVSNASAGERPNWAVNKDGSRIYVYDTSLRYRNDNAIGAEGYLPSYNARRLNDADGEFVPPAAGANVDISGYINYVGDDPDGIVPDGNGAFSINPFEDGVVWLNETRFVDGENGFTWPNDLTVNGLPPVVSNVALSDSSVNSTDVITVTADVVGVEGATVTEVNLIYSAAGNTETLAMTSTGGSTYSADLPAFPNFTAVSFYLEATDDTGLTGRDPLSGGYSFFVQDDAITEISFIQQTGDGLPGDSPLLGVGAVPVDITATVVSSAGSDGFITIQDRAAKWSGVFVEIANGTDDLSRGDQINISELVVGETFGVTGVELTDYTILGTPNTQADTMAVSLVTQDITGSEAATEEYEGVLLAFADVKVTTNQADGTSDFGEWEIGSRQGGDAAVDTLESGEGLRVDDGVNFGGTTYGDNLNDHVKIGAVIESFTGVLNFSFGNPKMILRGLGDVVADDWTLPRTDFGLNTPADGAEVAVTGDINVTWEPTTDFDGNDVTYEWVLYSSDTSTELAKVPSNNGSEASEVTLPYDTVDALLASAGVAVGESANLTWNVRVSDGPDTLAVSSEYDLDSNSFVPLYRSIVLERALQTSNEVNTGLPDRFALKQNYPNPFNPTTNIAFDLPQASNVELNVYDMLGRKVATLVSDRMNAGTHTMQFDASRLASGMYIYRIEAGSFTTTRKMMLIK